MKSRSAWALILPLSLAASCVLPSFENVPEPREEPVGGATNDNQGGEGNGPGQGGNEAVGGSAEGGAGPGGSELLPAPDSYVLQQDTTLAVAPRDGLLQNDQPSGLSVTDFDHEDPDRPAAFDADVAIEPDGSLSFTPAAGYFGRYVVRYTVEDASGTTAESTATFVVQPSDVELAAVNDGVGGVMLTGSASEGIGAAIAGLGDVNDDGYDDFAIAAPGASSGHGAVYVVFGRADFGALSLGELADTSTETRYAVLAGAQTAPLGGFVSTAGRFDSDLVPDIALGSPSSTNGAIFVVFGGQDLKTTLLVPELAAAGEAAIAITGASAGEQLGSHVSGGGDYNGDEKADLTSGIRRDGLTRGGVCTLFDIPLASGSIVDMGHPIVDDSSLFDLPLSLTFAGDVNADGRDDLLASSRRHVALIFGQGNDAEASDISTINSEGFGLLRTRPAGLTSVARVAGVGDVDGDDKADFAYCDEFSGQPRCHVFFRSLELGQQAQDPLANGDWLVEGFAGAPTPPLLAGGADLNEDGFADLLLADTDAAYVVFGRSAGFGAVDVGSLGSDGFLLRAATKDGLAALGSIGDVNADGYGDFALGEPGAASGSGQVYVLFGGPYAADQR